LPGTPIVVRVPPPPPPAIGRLLTAMGAGAAMAIGAGTWLLARAGTLPASYGAGGLAVGAAGVVTALMPALLRVVDAWARERHEARLAAEARHDLRGRVDAATRRLDEQADLLDRVARFARSLPQDRQAVIDLDRAWMIRVAEETGIPLPEGFGARPFDRPEVRREADELIARLRAMRAGEPPGADAPGEGPGTPPGPDPT
jgi:hypothetical protein